MMIGQKLRKLRKLRGLTQLQLSEILGYTDRSTISKIEKDINDVPTEKLDKIAKALNVSVSELLEEKQPNNIDISILTEKEKSDLDTILKTNLLFFGDGKLSKNDEETLKHAITTAFLQAREEKNKK